MPFDPAPIVKPKVGEFQDVADAMLRGCATSEPCQGALFDDAGRKACAIGAYYIGSGLFARSSGSRHDLLSRRSEVGEAYEARYGCMIEDDNDSNYLTREQIAARIAAL